MPHTLITSLNCSRDQAGNHERNGTKAMARWNLRQLCAKRIVMLTPRLHKESARHLHRERWDVRPRLHAHGRSSSDGEARFVQVLTLFKFHAEVVVAWVTRVTYVKKNDVTYVPEVGSKSLTHWTVVKSSRGISSLINLPTTRKSTNANGGVTLAATMPTTRCVTHFVEVRTSTLKEGERG